MLFDPSTLLQLRDIQPLQELCPNSNMLLKITNQGLNIDHYQGLNSSLQMKRGEKEQFKL